MTVKIPLKVLIVEDNPMDMELVLAELSRAGFAPEWKRVEAEADFLAEIKNSPAIILSDYSMPRFSGLRALQLLRESQLNIPFILISGTVGEEIATEAIKLGATDYLLKDRLVRLGAAVRRALQEVEQREINLRTERALRESERRLRIIFNESVLGIALVGADGRPVLTNTALQKMLGYTNEELVQMRFTAFTHPDDCASDEELYQQLLLGARKSYQLEKRYLRKDGQAVWARLSVNVAREVSDRVEFAIGMVEDITERRNLEAQVIVAQKMEVIGHLAGGVAHDFNNILAVIIGYSDLLMTDLEPDSPLRTFVEEIRQASDRAVGLTRQLLVSSRKQVVQPVVLNLNDVVRDMEKMLRRLIDEHIKFTLTLGNETGRIRADPGYIGQVLMNLVVNARDAMPNGGQLTIATINVVLDENHTRQFPGAVPGDHVMLSVKDTGTGMADEVKAHLFEAFFTTKPPGKGTGLGLATCKTIIQQCGGHISFSSELGKGSTFRVYFPRVDQPLELDTQFLKSEPLPRGTETLLVVEDDASVRHLARGVLQAQGYEVLSATNGQDGLRVAQEHQGQPIRLVITDVIMPVMGGKVMAEWLKIPYPDLKILFTSGYTDDAISQQGVLDPGTEFLSKPYSPATIARKVRELLDKPTEHPDA